MHELSVCLSLINQVQQHTKEQGAQRVSSIQLSVGPLSGVEIPLLKNAFSLCHKGTVAEGASLEISVPQVKVECDDCEMTSEVTPNNLTCPNCLNWRTRLIQGDELMLLRLEFALSLPINSPFKVNKPWSVK
ncbi:MAG: hydrogenase maturation nickel metallochaperone HypA [Oceanospirillaceae bacterium]|nr:hydrogenase maturation nickel metallochaperone HypA [Oceanospirillaceae bacterium]